MIRSRTGKLPQRKVTVITAISSRCNRWMTNVFRWKPNTAIGAIESDHLDKSFLACRYSLRCGSISCFACSGLTAETEARRTEVPFLFLTYLTEAHYWRGSNLGAFFSVMLYYLSKHTLLCTRYNGNVHIHVRIDISIFYTYAYAFHILHISC